MPIYRRKTVREVEAVQYADVNNPPAGVKFSDALGAYVTTIQGRHVCVSVGEWIVTESDGVHHYPVADDVFRDVFEPVQ